jgi:hypothetical protein
MLAPLQFIHLTNGRWYLRVEHPTPSFIATPVGELEETGKTWLQNGETIRICGTLKTFYHAKIGEIEVIPFDRFGYRTDPKTGLLVTDHAAFNTRYVSSSSVCKNEQARELVRRLVGVKKAEDPERYCFVF